MKQAKLESVLSEVLRDFKKATKKAAKGTEKIAMSQLTLERILDSGALSHEETSVLREFINYRGHSVVLNENTVRMVDKELLEEGFMDWIKEKGQAVVNVFKKGWAAVKNIWKNFKEFVGKAVAKIKEQFQKIWAWVQEKASAAIGWVKDIPKALAKIGPKFSDEVKTGIGTDIQNLKACTGHLKSFVMDMVSGKSWASKVESGDAPDNVMKEDIFRDKEVILALKEGIILEAGDGTVHPEDLIAKGGEAIGGEKGKSVGKIIAKIAHYIIEIMLWIFNWPMKVMQEIIKHKAGKIFEGVSQASKAVGGPGPFVFAALTLVMAESAEVLGHGMEAVKEGVHNGIKFTSSLINTALTPIFGPAAQVLATIAHVVMVFGFYYAIATIVLNVGKLIITNVKASINATGGGDFAKDKAMMKENKEFLRMQKLAGLG